MQIEYEATFIPVDKDEVRAQLKSAGAKLVRSEFLQKRSVFHLPQGHDITGGWARVRDEGNRITLSIKIVNGSNIEDQKESQIVIDSFEEGKQILMLLGCREKAYQETYRELWKLDGVEITIDTWPFLEPFVEIEGESESVVRSVAEKTGFDWSQAQFCAVGTLYSKKYNLSTEIINDRTPRIVFNMENPFQGK
jgi:adenylate cyclase class 2